MEIENIGSISNITPLPADYPTNSTSNEVKAQESSNDEYIGQQIDILA